MEELRVGPMSMVLGNVASFGRRCIFSIISKGPIPSHMAFIIDGNRRFEKKENLEPGMGHRAGFSALLNMLKYCCEMGIKQVSFYAFSIDNFKRRSAEVQILMDLMREKAEGLIQQESILEEYGIRVLFLGNLKLLSKEVRDAAVKVMNATRKHTKCMLYICVAYTSTDEIRNAIEQCCLDKSNQIDQTNPENRDDDVIQEEESEEMIKVGDVEKHMFMANAPHPDVMIRTSGETRLSNFLLWKSNYSLLNSPSVLWPEIGIWELVKAILSFQRNRPYLEKKKTQCR